MSHLKTPEKDQRFKQSTVIYDSSLGNRRTEHLHGLQNEWQMIQEWVHRHSEDSCFICAPPPETQQLNSKLHRTQPERFEACTVFLTRTTCCQTLLTLCWCLLFSVLGPETESAERWQHHETTGRERPESCRRSRKHCGEYLKSWAQTNDHYNSL